MDEWLSWLWPLGAAIGIGFFVRPLPIVKIAGAILAGTLGFLAVSIALSLKTMAMVAGLAFMLALSIGLPVMIGAAVGAGLRAVLAPRPAAPALAARAVVPWAFLREGVRYTVVAAFDDHDGHRHPVGETWMFRGASFVPHDDGLTLAVSGDGVGVVGIPLQWTPDEQAHVIERLHEHVRIVAPH